MYEPTRVVQRAIARSKIVTMVVPLEIFANLDISPKDFRRKEVLEKVLGVTDVGMSLGVGRIVHNNMLEVRYLPKAYLGREFFCWI